MDGPVARGGRVCSTGQRRAQRARYTGRVDNQRDAGLERFRPIQAMRVLLIGHDPSDGREIREALADGRDGSFIVECAPRLVDGLERLRENGIDAILLDLCLPDSRGIEAFEQVWRAAPHVPILVITSPDDEDAATQAVQLGAQDFLRRDRLDSYTLPRALKRIVERQAAEEELYFEQQRADVTLNSIGDAVLSTDIQSNVTYLNPVAERMTGWPRQEARGRPLAEVFQIIDATSRETARNPIAQAMELDTTVGLTPNCLLIPRDGPETAIEDSASPIHDRGRPSSSGIRASWTTCARS